VWNLVRLVLNYVMTGLFVVYLIPFECNGISNSYLCSVVVTIITV
jgi:hypothetical protein